MRWIRGFLVAFAGMRDLLQNEKHAKVHAVATVLVISLGLYLNIEMQEWSILCLTIGLVWMAEAFNTAIERLANRVTMQQDPLIKQAKDLGAAAVLITAIAAFVVGLLIFIPKFI